MIENTAKKQGNGFKKGQSGNPNGRPKGALNKTTLACQELLQGEAEAITRKAINMALQGDMTAIKLCMERIIAPRREPLINVNLPRIQKQADLPIFTGALLAAVTCGELSIAEAQNLQVLAKERWKHLDAGKDPFDDLFE